MTTKNPKISLEYRLNLPLSLRGGGAGVSVEASTTASAGQLLGCKPGDQITAHNDGFVTMWFLLGGPSVRSGLNGTPVNPGDKEVFTVEDDGNDYSYVSVITRTGTTLATFNVGTGP